MSELVTGEAVALGLQPAKLPSRVLAMVIDAIVYWGFYLALTLGLFVATASLDDAAAAAVSVSCSVLVLVGVPIAVETLSHGRSLGKLACGLRVVRDDGGPIRFRHALVRGAVGVVEIQATFGVVACVASLVSARGRRLGDVFAGTLVVRERLPGAKEWTAVPSAPPWLVAELSGVDLSAVPDWLWLAVRQYLSRMRQLDPGVGASMAQRLAADVSACTGAAVPQGVPPAAFLAAVVAERQAREARRVFGQPLQQGQPGVGWGAAAGAAPLVAADGVPGTAPTGGSGGSGWAVPGSADGSGQAAAVGGSAVEGVVSAAGPEPTGRERAGAQGTATGFVPPA